MFFYVITASYLFGYIALRHILCHIRWQTKYSREPNQLINEGRINKSQWEKLRYTQDCPILTLFAIVVKPAICDWSEKLFNRKIINGSKPKHKSQV